MIEIVASRYSFEESFIEVNGLPATRNVLPPAVLVRAFRRAGGSRLSFVLMWKFFQIEGRFPRHPGELPSVAVDLVARQLDVPAAGFEVTGRAVERFRAPIRDAPELRVFSRGDEDKMISWLAEARAS